jgi:hypothetical protein
MTSDNFKFNIHEKAKEMLRAGFTGQGTRYPDKSETYILLAADNPDVESDLPESGFMFWKACEFQYRIWQARKRRAALLLSQAENKSEAVS